MDRAQQSFTAAGLDVPSYVSFGNHDGLVQGNVAAKTVFETVATGCIKPLSVFFPDGSSFLDFSVQDVLDLHNMAPAGDTLLTPPDEERRYVSKSQYKQVFQRGSQGDGHGFDYVDPAQETASGGAAGYYAFNPVPGLRLISLDTVAEGGEIAHLGRGQHRRPAVPLARGRAAAGDERAMSWWSCSATTRSPASPPTSPTRRRRPAQRPIRTATTSIPAATSTPATRPRSTSATTWSPSCTSTRT